MSGKYSLSITVDDALAKIRERKNGELLQVPGCQEDEAHPLIIIKDMEGEVIEKRKLGNTGIERFMLPEGEYRITVSCPIFCTSGEVHLDRNIEATFGLKLKKIRYEDEETVFGPNFREIG